MKNIFESKKIRVVLVIIIQCILAILFFVIGVVVGAHKARFTGHWYQEYNRNFIGSRGPRAFMPPMGPKEDLVSGHGVAGSIFAIDGSIIKIKTADGVEKAVQITDTTSIRKIRDDITLAGIKTGDKVVVVGEPNDQGVIVAKLVRVMNSR